MKKIVGLLAVVGAAAAGVAVMAKRRGQDVGEFAGEWAARAKEIEDKIAARASDSGSTIADAASDAGSDISDAAVDLRDDLPIGDKA